MGTPKRAKSIEDEKDDEVPNEEVVESPKAKKAKVTTPEEEEDEEMMDEENEEDNENEEELEEENENDTPAAPTAPLAETDKLINVGQDYQAVIEPVALDLDANESVMSVDEDRDELIWRCPANLVNDRKLEDFLTESNGRFKLPHDRALFILQKTNFDIDQALNEVKERREIKDFWTEEEKTLFYNAYWNYGKNFKKIRSAMPHRSLASIVQYYYDTKKAANFRSGIEQNQNDTNSSDGQTSEEDDDPYEMLVGTCENCGERADKLAEGLMGRMECRPCILYLKLMRVPRPTNIRLVTQNNQRTNVTCPDYLKKYVKQWEKLTLPATGDPATRLKIGTNRIINDDDDDIIILDDCSLRQAAPPYVVEGGPDDDPVDSNTCRMTRDFDSPQARAMIDALPQRTQMSIPLIWRKNENICMEDIRILNEESRRRIFTASQSLNRVNFNDVRKWKKEFHDLKNRMDRKAQDSDLAPSNVSRSGRVRHAYVFTDEEKKDCVRCFHWYGEDFEAIAEIMGTKTPEQVRAYYTELGADLQESIKNYQTEMRTKMNESGESLV